MPSGVYQHKPHSEETKRKIGLANSVILKGKKLSEEHKLKIGLANSIIRKGMKFSEEHRKNMSLARLGKSSGMFGKKHSSKTKRKIGVGVKGKCVGEKHYMWKGENASYEAKHRRVDTLKGKPNLCEFCKLSDKNRRYEWASMSGNYDNIEDYKRLCVPCHRKLDLGT